MRSFIRALVARVSSSVKAPAAVDTPPALGRWGIQYDETVIDRKINQANEDHCGCCVVPKKETKELERNRVVRYEKTEEYLVPYVM